MNYLEDVLVYRIWTSSGERGNIWSRRILDNFTLQYQSSCISEKSNSSSSVCVNKLYLFEYKSKKMIYNYLVDCMQRDIVAACSKFTTLTGKGYDITVSEYGSVMMDPTAPANISVSPFDIPSHNIIFPFTKFLSKEFLEQNLVYIHSSNTHQENDHSGKQMQHKFAGEISLLKTYMYTLILNY